MAKITAKDAYLTTLRSLRKYPRILVPFLIFTLIDISVLLFIYSIPRQPLRPIFGPIIRTLWGERFLHYPANFMLLPKLVSLSRMSLAVVFSSLLTGSAVAMAAQAYSRTQCKLKESFRVALKKYLTLFSVIFLISVIFYLSQKIISQLLMHYFMAGHKRLLFINSGIWLGPMALAINFMFSVIVQAAFIYAIPVIIIDNQQLMPAIIKSFRLCLSAWRATLAIVIIPMLCYIPIYVLLYNSAFLMYATFPEIILMVLLVSSLLSSLVIDPWMTLGGTYYYLLTKKAS